MRSTIVVPSACSPASTSDADARKSVAMTCAPVSRSTPRAITVLPWIDRFAPSRCSSSTCWKRFSKIVSVIVAVPSATAFNAQNCACMSVGNAGIRRGLDVDGLGPPAAHVELDPIRAARDRRARLGELLQHRVEMLGIACA